ncbi:Midasin [Vitis vinifera]|uniref:Midasin n=1 Tax=Vitis vinifera TaxID=29760 RepID=A0A438K7B4_VITVI|nr:Midasin [Vitis vinifera]
MAGLLGVSSPNALSSLNPMESGMLRTCWLLLCQVYLKLFQICSTPFERMLIKGSVSELPAKVVLARHLLIVLGLELFLMAGKHLLNSVQTAYRFLLMEPDVFSRLWDWSCFLDLVQKLANLDMVDDDKFVKNISDIRWCGLQILFVI